jgi:hypothetical protein
MPPKAIPALVRPPAELEPVNDPVAAELAGLHPNIVGAASALIQLGRRYGRVDVTSVSRSYFTQARLYGAYIAGQSKYPAAPPGTSLHEAGRAFDLNASPALLNYLGRVWESWGGTWGQRFGDPIHFQA